MRKRHNNEQDSIEPPDKRSQVLSTADIKAGTVLVDILGSQWKLGKAVGLGGFGEIYLVTDDLSCADNAEAPFVAKVESHTSGPLFVEIHCYLRIGKEDAIAQWKAANDMQHLAIPHYVAYGSHQVGDNKYRFLILPRYEKDLQAVFDMKRKFNIKTSLTIGLQIIDALEYLHHNGYVHSDIKASNILLNEYKSKKPALAASGKSVRYHGCRPMRNCKVRKIQRVLRTNYNLHNVDVKQDLQNGLSGVDQIFLLDYGLACKYISSNGQHKPFDCDSRKAHAGTILFCSRDAHEGAQARRSDLECLGYNIIYWLTSDLPWSKIADPEVVHRKKCKFVKNLKLFLEYAFNFEYPRFLYDYFTYLQGLSFDSKPDYGYVRTLFKNALSEYGYKNNLLLDFENREGWGRKQKKIKCNSENNKIKCAKLLLQRTPLKSNLPARPNLRKVVNRRMKKGWASLLVDPEVIIKKARERKLTDTSENSGIQNLDIQALNPTSAMLDVFNKSIGKLNSNGHSPRDRGDWMTPYIEGYTPAMVEVYMSIKERENEEYQKSLAEAAKAKMKIRKQKCSKRINQKKSKVIQTERAVVHKRAKTVAVKRTYSLRG